MIVYIIIALCACVFLIGFGYLWGHQQAWLKWEDWTKGENLSPRCRNRIAGLKE
jgi:hypothetical protein